MPTNTVQARQRADAEDILLALLGLVAGPLLWWMSQVWKTQSVASSLQTLEYWIALICGFIGVALATLWLIFLLASLALIMGLKTRNAAVTYWSELFTPKFLRRIVISVIGTQLAFSSQAVAAPTPPETPVEASPVEASDHPQRDAFMPYVESPTTQTTPPAGLDAHHSPTPAPASSEPTASDTEPTSSATQHSASPQPRETAHAIASPAVTPTVTKTANLVPTPRQTSTIPVDAETPVELTPTQPHSKRGEFTPQPTPLAPNISAPPQSPDEDGSALVITAGDCLWDIAHYELGADATLFQIDRRWRQWWEHNSDVIGEDPHTLQPGSILETPPFTD